MDQPDLAHRHAGYEGFAYFKSPTLLQFVAENPIRRGSLPPNIVEVAKVILEAGAQSDRPSLDETLMLVSSGKVPRECEVQIPLIRLLTDAGASPNEAMQAALGHGEFAAVEELIRLGARISLPVAAATGRTEEARRLMGGATVDERHRGLALAAQFGRAEIARMLLDAGENPSRYNPPGCHAHSTPLHQAALAGHFEVVRMLVERGARLDAQDTEYHGTPAGWANYAGQSEIEQFLRDAERSRGVAESR